MERVEEQLMSAVASSLWEVREQTDCVVGWSQPPTQQMRKVDHSAAQLCQEFITGFRSEEVTLKKTRCL